MSGNDRQSYVKLTRVKNTKEVQETFSRECDTDLTYVRHVRKIRRDGTITNTKNVLTLNGRILQRFREPGRNNLLRRDMFTFI